MNMKLLTTLMAVCAIFSFSFGQNIKVNNPPETFSLRAVGTKTLGSDSGWRVGFAFPVLNFRETNNNKELATLDIWAMTDTDRVKRAFLGAGLNFNIYNSKHMTMGLTGGWSADFSNLERISEGRWSVGATLGFRF